jgi:ATP-dependent DNA helicase RecQ
MTFYASGNDCLRRCLLAYFGEKAKANCGNCSICLTEFKETDVTLEAQKIASCVYRLKQRGRSFGKTMIIDILHGSKNEKIRSYGFDTLSTWGIMKDTDAHRIRLIIDHLIDEGILLLEEGEYPVVTLGNAEELLRNEARVFMKLPEQHGEAVSNNAAQRGFNDEKSAGKKQTNEKVSRQGGDKLFEAQSTSAEIDNALLDKLRKLRKEIAAKESVPAYIVFSDASLRDMCRKKPVSLVQFSGINGVGQIKLEKYGEEFTMLIREHCQNE